ncbi:MAG: polysaccharide biosynthesis tyrosine autokinase [Cyanobacteria bacterium P01_A01_bin.15]
MEPKEYEGDIDFQKYWLILKRRWLLATVACVGITSLSAVFALLEQPVYESSGKLLFESDRSTALAGVEGRVGELEALTLGDNPLQTQAEILKTTEIAEKTISALNLKDDETGKPLDPRILVEGLDVETITGTDVMTVSYGSPEPEVAAEVVNQVMAAFLEQNILTNRAKAAAARKYIEQELPESRAAVQAAENAIRQFKEQNRIVVLEEEASTFVQIQGDLDREITVLKADLEDVIAQAAELRRQVGTSSEQAVDSSALSEAPGIQEVLVQLQETQSLLTVERTRYQPNHPAIINLEQQVTALNDLLQERAADILGNTSSVSTGDLQMGELRQQLTANLVQTEVQRLGLSQRMQELSAAREVFQQRSDVFPILEKEGRELDRQLLAANTAYETLLTRLQETQVAENQNIGNARIIEAAMRPMDPVGSNSKLLVVAGGFVGILVGISLAFLLDLMDSSVKTVKEAKEIFGYPLLGLIPISTLRERSPIGTFKSEPDVPIVRVQDAPRSAVGKAYQMLQANLKCVSPDKQLKSVVISSSVPREGKSEVSANLAASMAQVGRKILLVDADLQNSMQHHIWNLTNVVGLSHVIVGQAKLDEAIHTINPYLSVLPAGVVPPNSVALLDSERMASLVKDFSEDYDFVIFDTPPLTGNADVSILGALVDGILLIVCPKVVDVTRAKAAKEYLARSNQNVLGLIANVTQSRDEPDSYFYYTSEDDSDKDSGMSLSGELPSAMLSKTR